MIYYSKSTRGFYELGVNPVIPTDAVQVTEMQRQALIAGQSAGKEIVPDANGFPVLRDPPAPAPIAPQVVSATQAKIALAGAGLFDQIETFMDGLPKSDARRIAWTTASEFTRDSPTLAAVAQQFALSPAQVDSLFLTADSINV